MKESAGKAVSACCDQRPRGSLPVEEKSESRLGCTADENMNATAKVHRGTVARMLVS